MGQLLLFIILGFGSGSVIAALSIGVVLNFRGSGTVNTGLGAVAMLAAFIFYSLRVKGDLLFSFLHLGHSIGTIPALLITLSLSAAFGVLWDIGVIRRLRGQTALAKMVACLGLLLVIQSGMVIEFGGTGQTAPSLFGGIGALSIGGQSVPGQDLVVAGAALVAMLLLAALYKSSKFGLRTRAAAENETFAMLNGLAPNQLSVTNTALAFLISGLFGVLAAPLTSLDPVTITIAIIPALAAALLANFTSFFVAAVSGLALGCVESVITLLQTKSWFPTTGGVPLPGVADVVNFFIIAAVIYFRGNKLPVRGALREVRLPQAPAARRIARPMGAFGVVAALGLIFLPFAFRQALITSLIGSMVCLSLVVITGFVGQISLAQIALAGTSGFIITKVSAHTGIGFPITPVIGAAGATVVGTLVGLPALRVRGVTLAIVTMAAAVAIENFGFENATWGAGTSGSIVPHPTIVGLNIGTSANFGIGPGGRPSPVFGFLCLLVLLAAMATVALLRRSVWGHNMLAVRSNERAVAAAGISVRRVKIGAFALSSCMAGVAGALYAYDYGSVTTASFDILVSFGFVAFAYVGGITTVTGAVLGGLTASDGLVITAIRHATGLPGDWALVFGGAALILTVVSSPAGIAGAVRQQAVITRRRFGPQTLRPPRPDAVDPAPGHGVKSAS